MTRREAKLVLAAYRSNGADATDPNLAEALACARQDPELAVWFSRQRNFDAAVTENVRKIAPPPTLREEILLSLQFRTRRSHTRWLPLVAASILLALGGIAGWRTFSSESADAANLAMFAVNYVANGVALQKESPDPAVLRGWLVAQRAPMPKRWPESLGALHGIGCRTLSFQGRTITLICLGSDREFHCFIARLADFPALKSPAKPQLRSSVGGWSVATWADSDNFFVLVSSASSSELWNYLPAGKRLSLRRNQGAPAVAAYIGYLD